MGLFDKLKKKKVNIKSQRNPQVQNPSTQQDPSPEKEMHNQMVILTDKEADNPTTDFDNYSKTIAHLIRDSEPQFTVGIYGEWGTGKTTLMKKIRRELGWKEEGKNYENPEMQKIVTVWFNAWRYEREENFATIALMRTIAYSMAEHEKFESVSKTILRGLKIIGKDVLRRIATESIMTDKGWANLEEQLSEKTEFLNKLDKDTIYFEGINEIKRQIGDIRKKPENKEYRIVVFIDDLDRCSPQKALEVLESVKVFLDIEGFVYVIGLSIKTVSSLISNSYEAAGVKGDDYIKKIIQIPIRIPPWNSEDLEAVISGIVKKLKAPYNEYVRSHKNMISTTVEQNPREVKQFINNLILAVEIFPDATNAIDEKRFLEILVLEALKMRWNEFYVSLVNDNEFRKSFLRWESFTEDVQQQLRNKTLQAEKKYKDEPAAWEEVTREFREKEIPSERFLETYVMMDDDAFFDFLFKRRTIKNLSAQTVLDIIKNVRNDDWKLYRRVTETTLGVTEKEITESQSNIKKETVPLTLEEKTKISLDMLRDPKFQYRTREALQKNSGLSDKEFEEFLELYPEVRKSKIPDKKGQDLYQIRREGPSIQVGVVSGIDD